MTPELVAALDALAIGLRQTALEGFVVFARVGAFFALLPAFGEQVVPVRIRLVLALSMTVIVAPAVLPAIAARPDTPGAIARLLFVETAIGLVFGASLRLMVQALQMAGTMIAQATSLAQFFGGAGVDPQPAISQLLVMAGLALAVMSGLAEHAAQFLVLGYTLLPAGLWPDAGTITEWGVGRVAHAFTLAFLLAAPFVIGASIYNLALGAINRAMPQLMVAFIGAPALTLGGLVLLMLAAPAMLEVWRGALMGLMADPGAGNPLQ
ncbi:MAG: flagellar biosynthetic protein FliR [Rhodobacteraceae bacterium HLUCCA12]|nr:MAG: flagellar biosynthetic protein FliR [Rhodobacteraceae bacterium HLUCCA12]